MQPPRPRFVLLLPDCWNVVCESWSISLLSNIDLFGICGTCSVARSLGNGTSGICRLCSNLNRSPNICNGVWDPFLGTEGAECAMQRVDKDLENDLQIIQSFSYVHTALDLSSRFSAAACVVALKIPLGSGVHLCREHRWIAEGSCMAFWWGAQSEDIFLFENEQCLIVVSSWFLFCKN